MKKGNVLVGGIMAFVVIAIILGIIGGPQFTAWNVVKGVTPIDKICKNGDLVEDIKNRLQFIVDNGIPTEELVLEERKADCESLQPCNKNVYRQYRSVCNDVKNALRQIP